LLDCNSSPSEAKGKQVPLKKKMVKTGRLKEESRTARMSPREHKLEAFTAKTLSKKASGLTSVTQSTEDFSLLKPSKKDQQQDLLRRAFESKVVSSRAKRVEPKLSCQTLDVKPPVLNLDVPKRPNMGVREAEVKQDRSVDMPACKLISEQLKEKKRHTAALREKVQKETLPLPSSKRVNRKIPSIKTDRPVKKSVVLKENKGDDQAKTGETHKGDTHLLTEEDHGQFPGKPKRELSRTPLKSSQQTHLSNQDWHYFSKQP